MASFLDYDGLIHLWGIIKSYVTGVLPPASTATPSMNGLVKIGNDPGWAHGDHVHPVDSSRAPVSHASADTTYGVASQTLYGHAMASTSTPLVDSGSGTVGTDNGKFARADHAHPTDTSRAPVSHAVSGTTYGVATASLYGHAMAGASTPPVDSTSGAVGTDNGKYARADHSHPTDTTRVPTSRTVNGKALSSDVTLYCADVTLQAGADKSGAFSGCSTLSSALQTAGTAISDLQNKITTVYTLAGCKTSAELLAMTPSAADLGKVYNITDGLTTNDFFCDGAGAIYPKGSNAVVVLDSGHLIYTVPAGGLAAAYYHLSAEIGDPASYYAFQLTSALVSGDKIDVNPANMTLLVTHGGVTNAVELELGSDGTALTFSSGSSYMFDILAGLVDMSSYMLVSDMVPLTNEEINGICT